MRPLHTLLRALAGAIFTIAHLAAAKPLPTQNPLGGPSLSHLLSDDGALGSLNELATSIEAGISPSTSSSELFRHSDPPSYHTLRWRGSEPDHVPSEASTFPHRIQAHVDAEAAGSQPPKHARTKSGSTARAAADMAAISPDFVARMRAHMKVYLSYDEIAKPFREVLPMPKHRHWIEASPAQLDALLNIVRQRFRFDLETFPRGQQPEDLLADLNAISIDPKSDVNTGKMFPNHLSIERSNPDDAWASFSGQKELFFDVGRYRIKLVRPGRNSNVRAWRAVAFPTYARASDSVTRPRIWLGKIVIPARLLDLSSSLMLRAEEMKASPA